jgi:hypothetical protein
MVLADDIKKPKPVELDADSKRKSVCWTGPS